MIKSKAINIFNSFSKKEMDRFGEYLNSDFFNKNTRIITLFQLIKKFHCDFNNPQLSKDNLKKKLFGSKNSKDSYLRNLFSDLNKKAEDFLSYVNYQNNKSYNIHLIRELYIREHSRNFEERLSAFEKLVDKEKFLSPTYYHDKAFVTEMKSNFKVNRKLFEKTRLDDIQNRYKYFMVSVMECYCQNFIEQQRANIDHDFSILNHLLEFLEKEITKFKKDPLIQIYYYACKCFLNDCNENDFITFKNIYDTNKKNLSRMEKRNISSLIINYYEKNKNSEPGKYYGDALMIYMDMIENNYLSFTGSRYGNPIALRNIIILCMHVKDKVAIATFLRKLNDITAPENRKEIRLYANSMFNITIKDYKTALTFLSKINVNSFLESVDDNMYFKIDIKKYTIISFIELGYLENALVQIDAFKHYLEYSEIIPKDLKQRNHKMLNLCRELIFIKMKPDEYKLIQLEKKIIQAKDLNALSKEWLLEKCERSNYKFPISNYK